MEIEVAIVIALLGSILLVLIAILVYICYWIPRKLSKWPWRSMVPDPNSVCVPIPGNNSQDEPEPNKNSQPVLLVDSAQREAPVHDEPTQHQTCLTSHRGLSSRAEEVGDSAVPQQGGSRNGQNAHSTTHTISWIELDDVDNRTNNANKLQPLPNRSQLYDLHGMPLREAMQTVKQACGNAPQGTMINLITGRGLHSEGGKPVIKPAVENYLNQKGFQYQWKNAGGMVSVIT